MSAPTALAEGPEPQLTASGAESAPQFEMVSRADGRWVALSGPWNLRALDRRVVALEPQLAALADSGWDLGRVAGLDHAGALLLWRTWGHRLPERLEATSSQR